MADDTNTAEREAVARAIWALMREHEDRCDEELEDLSRYHPVWEYADAARASLAEGAPAGAAVLCWVNEDELPEGLTQEAYSALFPHSRVDMVRMFPVFGPTAQAAPAADYDHGPQSITVAEAARHVGKWLNERPNRPLDLRDVAMLCAHAQKAPAAGAVAGPVEWPTTCDGKEQEAWETWAQTERYDMTQHPLHYLFLNERTYAARQGWKAGLLYAVEQMKAAAPTPAAQADSVLKDHQIAALVNELRDIAVEFQGTQQLRERIAQVVVPALKAQKADSVLEDAARPTLFTTPYQRGEMAGDGRPCNNDHDPDCRWPDCICRHREAQFDAARKQGAKHD